MEMKDLLREMREEFLVLLKKRGWSKRDVERLKSVFQGSLSKIELSPDLFELAVRRALEGDLKFSAKLLGTDEVDVLEILFWKDPGKFPLPSEALKNTIEYESVSDFVEKADKLRKKLGGRDFMDLYLLFENVKEEKTEEENLLPLFEEKLKNLSLESLGKDDVEELKVYYELMKPSEKRKVLSLNVHPYVIASIVRKAASPVVIDGSNVLWKGGLSISYLDQVFTSLAHYKHFFFPYKIVFDRNIPHILPRSEREEFKRWESSPNVSFESPADDLIISLAVSTNAVVLSCDRFRDKVLPKRLRILTLEEIEEG